MFYYTATGNCLEVAKNIGGELYSIPQVLKGSTLEYEDEQIGIIFPVYMGSTPRIVVEFMKQVKLKTKYFFGIATFGKNDMGALNHFLKVSRSVGLEAKYVNRLLMTDSTVNFFDMDEELRIQESKKIEEHLHQIVQDIRDKKEQLYTRNR